MKAVVCTWTPRFVHMIFGLSLYNAPHHTFFWHKIDRPIFVRHTVTPRWWQKIIRMISSKTFIFICDGAYSWKNLTTTVTIMNRTDAENVSLLFNLILTKYYFPSQSFFFRITHGWQIAVCLLVGPKCSDRLIKTLKTRCELGNSSQHT